MPCWWWDCCCYGGIHVVVSGGGGGVCSSGSLATVSVAVVSQLCSSVPALSTLKYEL